MKFFFSNLWTGLLVLLLIPIASNAETYTYDAVGRLTSVVYPDGTSINYTYDKNGNILSKKTGKATVPLTPTKLSAKGISSRAILLTWADPNANENGVRIYRRVGKGKFRLYRAIRKPNVTKFVDRKVKPNNSYGYQVTAFNKLGASSKSKISSVFVLSTPKPLKANAIARKIKLSWKNVKGERGYIIERRQGKGKFKKVGKTRVNATRFLDKTVKKNKRYTYRVRAYGFHSLSSYSNSVRIKSK